MPPRRTLHYDGPPSGLGDWNNRNPWYCCFNYIPAYAINYTAMWDKTSFDAVAIDKELALAEQFGMSVLRAVLQYAVYNTTTFLRSRCQRKP